MPIEAQAQNRPTDASAPSESFLAGIGTFSDVHPGDIYPMLPKALRDLDAEDAAYFLRRFLARPEELWRRWQQKTWRVARLGDYKLTPESVVPHLLALVGFGDGSGLPDRIARRLSVANQRKLASVAVQFWKRRGRRDALSNAIRTFASGIRPAIDDWFFVRFLVDETLLGIEGAENADPWFLYESLTGAPVGVADGDVQVVIRVPDLDGNLDRQLVQDLAELARPPSERYEVAYVDFLDTFLDGRLGHWLTEFGAPATWKALDSTKTPKRWPGLTIPQGTTERVITPRSGIWSNYTASFLVEFPNGTGEVNFFFYVQATTANAYYVRLDSTIRQFALWKNPGVLLSAANVPEFAAPVHGIRVEVSLMENGKNLIRVYLDTELVIEDNSNGDYQQGTIGFRSIQSSATISRIEVYKRPLSVVHLTP